MTSFLNELFGVHGKVVVITGAAGEIGAEFVKAFTALGAKVLAVDIVEPKLLPANAVFHDANLGQPESIASIPEAALHHFGRVDVLINNAAVTGSGQSETLSQEEWRRIISINLDGTFQVAQAVGRQMLVQRSGRIINISSRTASMGMPFSAAYNASKGAIEALTRTLAVEWGDRGVLVNAIVPGVVRTRLNAHLSPEEERLYLSTIPLERFSRPADLVGAAVFLAGPGSGYVTGTVLFADGGNFMAAGIGTLLREYKHAGNGQHLAAGR